MDIMHLRNRNKKRDALTSTLVAYVQLWQKKPFIMIKKTFLFPSTQVEIVHERAEYELVLHPFHGYNKVQKVSL